MYRKYKGCLLEGIDPGTYIGQVQPLSLAGPGEMSQAQFSVQIAEPASTNRTVQQVVPALSAFVVVIAVVAFLLCKR